MTFWDGTRWGPAPPTTLPPRRGGRLFATAGEAGLITLLIFGLIASTALAGKGGGPVKGSLAIVMVDDMNADGLPNHAETVTFEVSTSATDKPYVNVRCYQGGAFVYDGWAGFYDAAWFGRDFTMSSTYWVGGAADCNARLVMWSRNGRERTLADMTFHVDS